MKILSLYSPICMIFFIPWNTKLDSKESKFSFDLKRDHMEKHIWWKVGSHELSHSISRPDVPAICHISPKSSCSLGTVLSINLWKVEGHTCRLIGSPLSTRSRGGCVYLGFWRSKFKPSQSQCTSQISCVLLWFHI